MPCRALSCLRTSALAAPLAWHALPFFLNPAQRGPVTHGLLHALHIHSNFPTTSWFNEHALCTDRVPGSAHKTLSSRMVSRLIGIGHAYADTRTEKKAGREPTEPHRAEPGHQVFSYGVEGSAWHSLLPPFFWSFPAAKVNMLHFLNEGEKPQPVFLGNNICLLAVNKTNSSAAHCSHLIYVALPLTFYSASLLHPTLPRSWAPLV